MPDSANRFIVVSGLPASGKSTLGAAVAAALNLPLFDKDEILEALYDSLGVGDTEWRSRLSRAADVVLQRLVLQSRGAVIASWWRHPKSDTASGTPVDWLRSLTGDVVELHCVCRPEVAVQRFFARSRHAGHLDEKKSEAAELMKFREAAAQGCLGIGRVVEVDMELPVDLGMLLERLARKP